MEKVDKIAFILAYTGVLVIAMLGIVFAETLIAGEILIIPLDFEIVNCSVTNSTYDLEGLNLSWFEKNIIISTHLLFKSDNLTISCWIIKEGKIIKKSVSRSRGTSCFYEEDYDWNCSEWTECLEENQTRTCRKYNNCHTTFGKPNETRDCIIGNETDEHECVLMAGYTWCELKQKCLRDWEELCDDEELTRKPWYFWLLLTIGIIILVVLIWLLKDILKKTNRNN